MAGGKGATKGGELGEFEQSAAGQGETQDDMQAIRWCTRLLRHRSQPRFDGKLGDGTVGSKARGVSKYGARCIVSPCMGAAQCRIQM